MNWRRQLKLEILKGSTTQQATNTRGATRKKIETEQKPSYLNGEKLNETSMEANTSTILDAPPLAIAEKNMFHKNNHKCHG